jgi:hypothetical protein
MAGCSYVAGSCNTNQGVSLTVPSIATRSFTCPTGEADVTLSSGDSFTPGAYGAVTVSSGETLSLARGTYTVQSLTIEDGATISMPSSGTVEIDSCDKITIGSAVTTTGVSSSADALRLQLYSASSDHTPLPGTKANNAIYIGASSTIYATLTAPTGAILIDEWADVFGFLHASEGILLNGAVLDATGVAGNNCAYNPQFGTCEAENIEDITTSITDGGVCVENGESFVDTSCSDIDLAVDFGCSEYVPVCNHGSADAPAGVELTFYPRAGHQFADTSPDPSWAIGTCTVTDPIPSGSCVSQACDPALTDSDVTVVANVDEAVSECSLLDNWSIKDPTEICPLSGGGASQVEFTEIYKGTCPGDSQPVWGLLTWNSQTPGASDITFEARVAGSEGSLATNSFTTVGTAHQTPTDTQICSYLSAAPECPVDIAAFVPVSSNDYENVTNAMTGNMETVSFLELHVSLNPSASDGPTLEDWNLTYSCRYDQ